MTAVIYARYSSDNQREESIEGQIRECTAYAEKNDITIVKHYIDRAISAKTDNRPEGLTITTHVCRGNYHSTWASEGDYFTVAPFLLAQENVDAFYLEFDDARSGSFEPLKYVADGKKVVLGLVTTKSPRLENKDTVIARIHEAEKYIPLDRLCLSPQCGFASCEIGNKLTELEQWNKLKLVKEIAETVWGK